MINEAQLRGINLDALRLEASHNMGQISRMATHNERVKQFYAAMLEETGRPEKPPVIPKPRTKRQP